MGQPLAPDLNAIAVFAKVVELKSFRAAGNALGIPRSTVSVRVAQLEQRLGVRLLERTTRTLRLTHAGTTYYRSITPALEALDTAARAIDDLNAKPSGPLKLTTTIEGGQVILAPLLAEYMRRYPDVQLQVELTDRRVDLLEEGFDLALRMGPLPDSSLIAKKLRTPGHLRVYASPSYLARYGDLKKPQQLETRDCLVMTGQTEPSVWRFQVKKKATAVTVRARASANSFVLLRELAVAGLGVARLPEYIAAPAVEGGKLRAVLDAFQPPAMPWHAVYPSARHLSPKLRALVALVEEHYGRAAS
jgi:DNA-binding transcriptional LysR family regulator